MKELSYCKSTLINKNVMYLYRIMLFKKPKILRNGMVKFKNTLWLNIKLRIVRVAFLRSKVTDNNTHLEVQNVQEITKDQSE